MTTDGEMNQRADATEASSQAEKEHEASLTSRDVEEPAHDVEKGIPEPVDATKPNADDETPKRSKAKTALIMFALCMAVFLSALDVTIITTALPTISQHFHSSAGYTWIGSAFLLANAASIPSWGKVSDIFGRKPMLLLANIIFMVGSLVAALANSIGMLIAARAVQGVGGGGLVILVNITIGDLFSLRSRGAFYGMVGAVWAVAGAIGPVIGGAFSENVSWRWCFYINLPFDGLAFFILLFFLDVKTPTTPLMAGLKAIDWVGSTLVVGATLMFLFGLQYGGVSDPWSSAIVICLIVFGVVTFGIFILWEVKGAIYPVMPMSLFKTRSNACTLVCVFVHGFVFISSSYYLPLYFQTVRAATPIMSGVYVLPTAVALALTSIATGILIRKTGLFLPPIYFGFLFMVAGFGAFIDLTSTSGWAKLIIFQLISGFGIGPLFQAPIIALQAHINPRDIATATSTLGFVRQLATSTSVVIGQVVYQNQMSKRRTSLVQLVGPQLGNQLADGDIGANAHIINALPTADRATVLADFADSLKYMWILYTCVAFFGLVCSFGIKRKELSKQHTETKTGLEAQKEYAAQRATEKAERRVNKQNRLTSPSPAASSPAPFNQATSPVNSELPASPSTPVLKI